MMFSTDIPSSPYAVSAKLMGCIFGVPVVSMATVYACMGDWVKA
ncbi:hypothetical protein NST41_30340 [Paenibacillus sp. FSL L8-0696]